MRRRHQPALPGIEHNPSQIDKAAPKPIVVPSLNGRPVIADARAQARYALKELLPGDEFIETQLPVADGRKCELGPACNAEAQASGVQVLGDRLLA